MAAAWVKVISGQFVRNIVKKQLFVVQTGQCFIHRTAALLGTKGIELRMPSLSPTMTQGTIVRWLKKEGDQIQPGDALCEIETDKAVVAFEIEEAGTLAKILMPADSKNVPINALIAVMVEEGDDWKNVEVPSSTQSTQPERVSSVPQPQTASVPTGSVKGTELRMPSLSPTMTEGTIVRWLKKEGDPIQPGDTICEIQTDKAVVGFELEETGILAKILIPADSTVKINELIAMMVEEGEDWKDVIVPVSTQSRSVAQQSTTSPSSGVKSTPEVVTAPARANLIGPAVKHYLAKFNLNPNDVPASGPHNVLLKRDVIDFAASGRSTRTSSAAALGVTAPPGTKPGTGTAASRPSPPKYVDTELTNMRRAIAKRLSLSKATIPHAYMSYDCEMDSILGLRKQLKSEQNIAVSVNDFIIKASALALRKVPDMNARWNSDQAQRLDAVDISVAVATDSGLITPIVRAADGLSLSDISSTIRELAGRARENKLKPHEFEGGSFSVSNLGMFGIKHFTAVINPPQASIMAVGASRGVVLPDLSKKTVMSVTVSYDARVCADITVAEFLEAFKTYIEQPSQMI